MLMSNIYLLLHITSHLIHALHWPCTKYTNYWYKNICKIYTLLLTKWEKWHHNCATKVKMGIINVYKRNTEILSVNHNLTVTFDIIFTERLKEKHRTELLVFRKVLIVEETHNYEHCNDTLSGYNGTQRKNNTILLEQWQLIIENMITLLSCLQLQYSVWRRRSGSAPVITILPALSRWERYSSMPSSK